MRSCLNNCKASLRKLRRYITIEPVVFLSVAGYMTFLSLKASVIYFKICEISYSLDPAVDCHNLSSNPSVEDAVQKEASLWILYYTIAYVGSSSPMILVWCTWGDSYDLKTVLFLPIIGSSLQCVLFIVTTVFPMSPLWIIPAVACLNGFWGLLGLIFAVSPQFIVHEEHSKEWLTIRLAILTVTLNTGAILGSYLASVLLLFFSFQYVLLGGQVLLVGAAAYLALMVQPLERLERNMVLIYEPINNQRSIPGQLRKLFSEVLITLARRRNGRRRAYVLIGLLIYLLIWIADIEIDPIFNIFIMRRPINFTTQQYTMVSGLNRLTGLLGTLVAAFLLKKVLHFSDTILVMVGCLSLIGRMLTIGLSKSQWSIWMSCGLGSFSMLFVPGLQAFLVDQVEQHEKGNVMTAMGMATNLAMVLSSLFYNDLYRASEEWFPGLTFLVAAGVVALTLLLTVAVHVDNYLVSGRSDDDALVTPHPWE